MKYIKKVATTPLSTIAKVIDSITEQTNDRTNAPSIHAVREAVKGSWGEVYPIGSIYLSVGDVDPSEVFGGAWERIKDKFLLASGDTYEEGTTGGAETHSGTSGSHVLTADELPSHTHSVTGTAKLDSGYLVTATPNLVDGGTGSSTFVGNGGTNALDVTGTATGGGQGNGHTHSISLNVMPPYLAVNVWVRTA